MVRACSPLSKSHTLTVSCRRRRWPATCRRPSSPRPGRDACGPRTTLTNLPVGTSQILTNLSAPQVASILSSGLKQTPKTVSLWPFLMSTTSLPVAASKTFTSPSSVGAPPPVARSLPLLEKARATTRSAKPVMRLRSLPVCASQRITSWKLPLAMVFAVGAVGQRLDQRQMGGLDRLAVRRLEIRVDEAADVGAGAGVVDVDLVAARGDDGRLVGADGDAANRVHAGRRQRTDDLRPLVGDGRRLGALVDPELDEGQLFRRQRLLALAAACTVSRSGRTA